MIRPVFDSVTEITFEEAQDVLNYFKDKGVEYIDLAKNDAAKEKVEEVLSENPDAGVLHYDHGNETSWIGADEKAVVDQKNVGLLAGRQCYANNCSSAKKLGVDAWKLNATYWGYKNVFVFTTDSLEEFKEFVNNGIKRRVDGFSWKECLIKTKELANKLIDQLIAAGKGLAASCLAWDRDILVCYNAEPPTSDCLFRRVAIRVFGHGVGWKMTRTFPFSIALFCLGFGIALGKLTHLFWEIGGLEEVFSLQGDYVGYGLMFVGFLLAYYQIWSLLKRKRGS